MDLGRALGDRPNVQHTGVRVQMGGDETRDRFPEALAGTFTSHRSHV